MTYKEAKLLRDRIRMEGPHCVVPTGHGPCGYFARIFPCEGPPRDFRAWTEYMQYKAIRDAKRQIRRPRSPIEAMIDAACGVDITQYADDNS